MIRPKLQWRILSRIKNSFDRFSRITSLKLSLYLSRIKAHKLRNGIISENGESVVDSRLKKEIKSYCSDRFGSEKHWPWIALYTEMRGDYRTGWIPADYYRYNLLKRYNPDSYSLLSSQKCFDHRLFSGFSLLPILIRVSGVYYDSSNSLLSEKDAISLLKNRNGEVVIKKDGGRGGEGLSFVHSSEISLQDIYNGNDIIIQPIVKQCNSLHDLHPESVNTLRVFTHLNNSGTVDVLVTVLRFGIGNTRCDGIDAGGGFCRVGDNGVPAPFWYNTRGMKGGEKHPDTGIEIGTIHIPNTDLAIKKCIEAHESYPYVKFIGWDVAINEINMPVLLEWNAKHPGFAFFEALFGPLLADYDII